MITKQHRYLLERCLRLEAQLSGEYIAPPVKRQVAGDPLPSAVLKPMVRRIRHDLTTEEIAQMREMRAHGLAYAAIARHMDRSVWSARRYTRDVEQEKSR